MAETTSHNEKGLSLKPTVRMFAILFAGIVILLCGLYWLFLRYDFQPLYAELPIEDAAWISEELHAQDIRHRIQDGGTAIAVPASDVNEVRLAIYRAEGPAKDLRGFELFNESEMGLTDFAQKIKFQRAIQGELSRTIIMVDGVRSARVHIALPERSVFRSEQAPPTAAVTLQADNGFVFPVETIRGIQRLVAAAVPSLALDNVTVLNGSGFVISPELKREEGVPSISDTEEILRVASLDTAFAEVSERPENDVFTPKQVSTSIAPDTRTGPSGNMGAAHEGVTSPSLTDPTHSVSGQDAQSSAPTPSAYDPTETTSLFWIVIATLFVIVVVFFIVLRALRKTMSAEDRDVFSEALKEALRKSGQEGLHAS